MKNLILKFILILTFISSSYAQKTIRFHQTSLDVEGNIRNVLVRDIDGDEAPDLVSVHDLALFPGPEFERFLSVHLQRSGIFSDTTSYRMLANQGEILFDIGDLDGDLHPEIVFLKDDGVYLRRFDDGPSKGDTLLMESTSVFAAPDVERLRHYPFLHDLDRDGKCEIFVNQPHQIVLLSISRTGIYHVNKKLYVSSDYSFSGENQLQFSLRLPEFHLRDFNGDGYDDILIITASRLDVFIQHPLSAAPHGKLVPPDLRYQFGSHSMDSSFLDPLAPASLLLETDDLNGDGRTDILLSKATRGSFASGISQVQVYFNKNNRYTMLPDHVITAENIGGEHLVADINQDGKCDIATLTYSIGLSHAAKFLITRKASFRMQFYPMKQDGTYRQKPDSQIGFSRKMQIRDLLRSPFCQSLEGDFNGDGVIDLLLATESDRITVYPGGREGLFNKKNAFSIKVPVSSHMIVHDLNGDDIDDLVFYYPDDPAHRGQITLVLSQRGERG